MRTAAAKSANCREDRGTSAEWCQHPSAGGEAEIATEEPEWHGC